MRNVLKANGTSPPYPDFAELTRPCIEREIVKNVKVGEAILRLVRLEAFIDLHAEYLEINRGLFYHVTKETDATADSSDAACNKAP